MDEPSLATMTMPECVLSDMRKAAQEAYFIETGNLLPDEAAVQIVLAVVNTVSREGAPEFARDPERSPCQ